MDKRWQRGEVDVGGLTILAVIIIIMIIMPKDHQKQAKVTPGTSYSSSYQTYQSAPQGNPGSNSSYTTLGGPQQAIYLNSGNARYAYQPYEEFIMIENHGANPIDITGWQLKNGKDKRAYDQGGSLQRFSADIATLPKAALYLSPSGNNFLQDVVLARGELAIVTTGKVGVNSPYKIESFKENTCSGYLEALPEYAFNPPLTRHCPLPSTEPGLDQLDTGCRKFVERLSSCHTPKFETRDMDREICYNCVDGVPLSNACVVYLKEHFNYKGCIAYHAGDPNFSSHTWRIFLGRGWEMYAQDYETIELFDQFGQLVSFQNY